MRKGCVGADEGRGCWVARLYEVSHPRTNLPREDEAKQEAFREAELGA